MCLCALPKVTIVNGCCLLSCMPWHRSFCEAAARAAAGETPRCRYRSGGCCGCGVLGAAALRLTTLAGVLVLVYGIWLICSFCLGISTRQTHSFDVYRHASVEDASAFMVLVQLLFCCFSFALLHEPVEATVVPIPCILAVNLATVLLMVYLVPRSSELAHLAHPRIGRTIDRTTVLRLCLPEMYWNSLDLGGGRKGRVSLRCLSLCLALQVLWVWGSTQQQEALD